jgi:hypothetical protein
MPVASSLRKSMRPCAMTSKDKEQTMNKRVLAINGDLVEMKAGA